MDLVFTLYLETFIGLDMIWELSLDIVILHIYLQHQNTGKHGSYCGHYADLTCFWIYGTWVRCIALGDSILYNGAYVLTDPLIYIPWITIVILVFCTILLLRLNKFSVILRRTE